MAKEDTKTPGAFAELEALRERQSDKGRVAITDLVELCVVAMFFAQKLGKATSSDIRRAIDYAGGDVNEHLLEQAIGALQARNFLSYGSGRIPSGERERMWKPRRVFGASAPEIAHLSDLLPRLTATPEAQAIINELNDEEAEGSGTAKRKRELQYRDYHDLSLRLRVLDEVIGSQPSSPWLDALVKRGQKNHPEQGHVVADMRFWRDDTGRIVMASDALRGWLRTGLRVAGFGDSVAAYIAVSHGRFTKLPPVQQVGLPIIDPRTGAGCGIGTYEVLGRGAEFEFHVRLPTTGVMSPRQFNAFVAGYGPRPLRGLSPARGARFGKVALCHFSDLGATSNAAVALSSVMDEVPEDLRPLYEELLRDSAGLSLKKGADAN